MVGNDIIIIKTHYPRGVALNRRFLVPVLDQLLRAVSSDVRLVLVTEYEPDKESRYRLDIGMYLDSETIAQLKQSLTEIYGHDFIVESELMTTVTRARQAEIQAVTEQIKKDDVLMRKLIGK